MEIRPLPAEEAAVRRYVTELWLPYHQELEATVEAHGLADGVDLVGEEVAFRLDRLDGPDHRGWVAVDGTDGRGLADIDAPLAGFVTADVETAPAVFDTPDRLVIGDIYVREPYRGTGLARRLVDRVAERARRDGCSELALDVDVGNDRAASFYRRLGFETIRRRMTVDVEER
jgi:ribosomal protein S18 acetylase RimI-like enzyme